MKPGHLTQTRHFLQGQVAGWSLWSFELQDTCSDRTRTRQGLSGQEAKEVEDLTWWSMSQEARVTTCLGIHSINHGYDSWLHNQELLGSCSLLELLKQLLHRDVPSDALNFIEGSMYVAQVHLSS